MKKYTLPIIVFGVIFSLIIVVILSIYPYSSSPISVKKFVSSQNGTLGIERLIALTEISDEIDLVFYYTSNNQIAANFLIKNNKGQYVKLVMTSTRSVDDINNIVASTRILHLFEATLYWGIAQSPDWTINHPNAHQIVVDGLTLVYYLHDKSLDEETLDLEFVQSIS